MKTETYNKLVSKFANELIEIKYLYYRQFDAALADCMRKNGISWASLNDDIIDAFKFAICDVFHGGCEPEFSTEEAWTKWEAFTMAAYFPVTEQFLKEATASNAYWKTTPDKVNLHSNYKSPFVDKNKPYFLLVDKSYGEAFDKTLIINNVAAQYGI